MARRVFAAGSVSNSTGAPLRLSFYTTQTGTLPESDLWTVDGSFYPSVPIPNGTVLTTAAGAYSSFAGPDDIDSLWIAPSNGAARTQITATRAVASAPTSDTTPAALASDSAFTGTYGKLWTSPTASTTLTGTLAAWVITAVDCTAGAGARTLPAASSVVAGVPVCAKKADTSANNLVVSRAGSDLIYGTGSGATSKTLSLAGEAVEFVSNGVDKWTVRSSDTPSAVLASTYAAKSANLSDLTSPSTARTSLGLGAAAVMSTADIAADSALTGTYATRLRVAGVAPTPVSSNCWVPTTVGGTTQQTTAGTSRSLHVMATAATCLQLVYVNWYGATGDVDTDNSASVPINASIEYSGTIYRVTFQGLTTGTMDPGGVLVSDPIGLLIPAGSTFAVRTYTSATSWYGAGASFGATGTSGGFTATTDLTAPGSAAVTNTNHYLMAPSAILGLPSSTTAKSVLIHGDSIAINFGKTGNSRQYADVPGVTGGLLVSALDTAGIGYVNIGQQAAILNNYINSQAANRRLGFAGMIRPTSVICEFGRNDLDNSRTLVQIQTDLQALWTWYSSRGIAVFQTTITPKTTSTDSWATTGNQTVASAPIETVRVALNNWIRTGPSPLTGYFEVADTVETGRNSGIWKAANTGDGLHPNDTGHAAASAAIVTANLV